MVIIELTYIKPFSEVEHFLNAHIQFLDKYYDQGLFIASGRKVPRDGGVILALTGKGSAAEIIKEDPFHQEGIAEYRLVEFEVSNRGSKMNGMWNELTNEMRKNYFENYKIYVEENCSHVNSNATILSNWLYALNLSSFCAIGWIISLKLTTLRVMDISWWFLLSLFFCILSTAIEWLRFSTLVAKKSRLFLSFTRNQITSSEYNKESYEHKSWLWVVSICRVLGYIFLFAGVVFILNHIKV